MTRPVNRKLIALALFLSLSDVSSTQELSKEYVYVGGRLLTVDVPSVTGDPDLWIESLTADGDGPAGGSVEVGYSIRNSGGATDTETTVGFYFSTDSTVTTGDTASSTTVAVGSPFSGPSSGFVSVQIPSELAEGSYFFGAIIDPPFTPPGSVNESNESNNTVLAETGGAPGTFTVTTGVGTAPVIDDLTPTSGSGGSQLFTAVFDDAEGPETLRDLGLLIGVSASTGCYVTYDHSAEKFYLRNFDDTDWIELIDGQVVSNTRCTLDSYLTQAVEDTDLTVSWNISFNSSFSSGSAKDATLEARDDVGLYASSTEGTWTVPAPNLSLSGPFLPSSGVVDVDVPVSIDISSDGPETSNVTVEFHRTTTSTATPPTPSPSTEVGSCNTAVPAEGTIECLDSVTLSSTGNHRVWAIFVDHATANEGSAIQVGDISISSAGGSGDPDLALSPTQMSPEILPVGGYGFMNFLVLNNEFVSYPVSDSSTVGLYLSSDPLVTTSDNRIATCSVGSFSTWYSEDCAILFFDPDETGLTNDTDYYVKAIADIYDDVSESNEDNQTATYGHLVHYGGDAVGTTIYASFTSAPAEASLGETISYSLRARNMHPSNVAAEGPFYGKIYISETGYLGVGWSQYLGTCTSWSENTEVEFWVGEPHETTCSGTVDIPASVQGTNHYLVVDFDFDNEEDSLLPDAYTRRRAIDLVLPPAVESVTPASGSGGNQIFTLHYSDGNGADDISYVQWLMNGSLIHNSSCGIVYYLGTNLLYLINDDGASWASPITPGSGSVSNSTCSIDGSGIVVTSSGNDLEIILPVSFDYYLGSNQTQWMMAADGDSQSTGWVQSGTWTIPGVESVAPLAESVSPASGGDSSQEFAVTFSDANGTGDIAAARVLFNASVNGAGACYVEYLKAANSIRLRNDAETNWTSSPVVLGTSTILQNSQCKIDAAGSSVSTVGTELELTLDVEFKPAFVGARNIYGVVWDLSGYVSGWQTLGTWDVPGVPALVEVNGLVVAEAESGEPISGSTRDWVSQTSVSGYSGSAYLEALPDSGTTQDTGYIGVSPEIRLPIQFSTTGTYYVWVRAYLADGTENTIHAGLDGAAVSTADRIESTTYNSWTWTNSTMDSVRASINVSSSGLHELNLWMREDGFRIDKVLLTTDSSFTPTGTGPAQSPETGDVIVPSTGGGPQGYADPNWTLSGGTAYVTIDGQFPFGPWLANTVDSGWISPQASYASSGTAPGTYTYSTTFDMGAHNPSTASITFVVAVDDALTDVKINGVSTGLTASGLDSFSSPMTIDSGFTTGTNTLEFVTSNGGSSDNPTGLRVEFQY